MLPRARCRGRRSKTTALLFLCSRCHQLRVGKNKLADGGRWAMRRQRWREREGSRHGASTRSMTTARRCRDPRTHWPRPSYAECARVTLWAGLLLERYLFGLLDHRQKVQAPPSASASLKDVCERHNFLANLTSPQLLLLPSTAALRRRTRRGGVGAPGLCTQHRGWENQGKARVNKGTGIRGEVRYLYGKAFSPEKRENKQLQA